MRDPLQFLAVLVVMAAVVAAISAPLRRPRSHEDERAGEIRALEAARDAKYGEIRDAELDRRTGKLSPEDWAAVDAQLRGEAAEILRALDAVVAQPPRDGTGSSHPTS